MRAVVTGGAGFLGSHLCDALIADGYEVVCVDNFCTGRPENIEHLLKLNVPHFDPLEMDVSIGLPVDGPVDVVVHMASPASPPAYSKLSIETLRVGSAGTENALKLALSKGARFVLTSTSEVYGDPEVHPQFEAYWGCVNPIGPRSMYDEAKRFAEALTSAYALRYDVNVGIARIFNTYGPRMAANDGRVVSNFIAQALTGQPLTVYGGYQTRSFCYVDDMIRGLMALIHSDITGPVNLGNPCEYSVAQLGSMISMLAGTDFRQVISPVPRDDPQRRCPDITMARNRLGWEPTVDIGPGLLKTITWFREHPSELHGASRWRPEHAV